MLTDSELSRDRIVEDLGVAPERISVLTFPQDMERARRIADLRAELPQENRLLYVGRFAPHKNLERLARVFPRTQHARRGGRLLLVGGWEGEVEKLRGRVGTGVEVRGECSEEELDRLLATSRALVLPSLEEGFGLPAFEAVASGLPVAVSRTGALTELPAERAAPFDPLDEDGMAAAIDLAVARGSGDSGRARRRASRRGPGRSRPRRRRDYGVSAYAFLAGRSDARPPAFGSWRSPFGVPLDVALGRLALIVLFVLVPLFNPPLWEPGDERVYLGLAARPARGACAASARSSRAATSGCSSAGDSPWRTRSRPACSAAT